MPSQPSFEIRDLHFELGDEVPRYWHGGRRSTSLFMNGLSIFFPLGEQFFVRSVKAQRGFVSDPALLEEVRLFCGQEGIHAREHIRYNQMLQAQGYPIAQMEERIRRVLERARRLPARTQLAVTASLEHFTAILARMLLTSPARFDGAHPGMAALWRWHAVEESEHKAVAFDVYRAAGGHYAERVAVMAATTLTFIGRIIEHQFRLMRADGIASSPREWATLFYHLLTKGGIWQLFTGYWAWYRPGFHPNDLDTQALVEAWKREFTRPEAGSYAVDASPAE